DRNVTGVQTCALPIYRPMDHHGTMFGVVGADVFQLELLRQLVIELNRRALPLAAERVGDSEVDLGSVKRAVPLGDRVRLARGLEDRKSTRLNSSHVSI